MQDFRQVFYDCDLHDLGFEGITWTYDNKQVVHNKVRLRLDRAIAGLYWSNFFPNAKVIHLTSSRSDHCPIFISLNCTCSSHPQVQNLVGDGSFFNTLHKKPSNFGEIANNLNGVMGSLYAWKRSARELTRTADGRP
jgi:hypothetical protein